MVTGLIRFLTASGAGRGEPFFDRLVVVAGMSIGTLFTLFVLPASMWYSPPTTAPRPTPIDQGDRRLRSRPGALKAT